MGYSMDNDKELIALLSTCLNAYMYSLQMIKEHFSFSYPNAYVMLHVQVTRVQVQYAYVIIDI